VQVAGDHLGALGLGVPSGDVGRLPVQLSLERLARSSGTKYSGPRKIPIITTTKFPGIQSRAHRHNRHNKPAHPTGSISLISQFTVFAGLSMPLSCQYLVTNCDVTVVLFPKKVGESSSKRLPPSWRHTPLPDLARDPAKLLSD
jgi:hypothetical protein